MFEATFEPRFISSLDVLLNEAKVGTIIRTPGEFNTFCFEDSYRATSGIPVLSLSFRAAAGGLRKDPKSVARALPAFLANLFPEDKLREGMEKHYAGSVREGNDFDLLVALGSDLPGAVRVVPSDKTIVRLDKPPARKPNARFSLAGVQMKLSVIKNTGRRCRSATNPCGTEYQVGGCPGIYRFKPFSPECGQPNDLKGSIFITSR